MTVLPMTAARARWLRLVTKVNYSACRHTLRTNPNGTCPHHQRGCYVVRAGFGAFLRRDVRALKDITWRS